MGEGLVEVERMLDDERCLAPSGGGLTSVWGGRSKGDFEDKVARGMIDRSVRYRSVRCVIWYIGHFDCSAAF